MAGQSVGLVTCEQGTVEILDELIEQALVPINSRRWSERPSALAPQPRTAGGGDQRG
jgi:hypothetical protein